MRGDDGRDEVWIPSLEEIEITLDGRHVFLTHGPVGGAVEECVREGQDEDGKIDRREEGDHENDDEDDVGNRDEWPSGGSHSIATAEERNPTFCSNFELSDNKKINIIIVSQKNNSRK